MDQNDSASRPMRPRRNFSVRLPDELYGALEALSKQKGQSMNKLVGTAVALLTKNPDLAPSAVGTDIEPTIARRALVMGPEAVGPLKGIAKHANNRDQVALACVLWAAAARIVLESNGSVAAAEELAHSAHAAQQSGHLELAVALWEESFKLDPNNLEVVNRLGQELHHLAQRQGDDVERYREARDFLARVTFIDNRAKLFHGWAELHVARADGAQDDEERAITEIDEALKHWAFGQRDGKSRTNWLRQVNRFRDLDLDDRADSLIEFANRNARWEPIGNGGEPEA